MIVMKFGGTSVAGAEAILQAAAIVAARADRRPVVVVSAMARVTDALLKAASEARERRFDSCGPILSDLRQRHFDATRALLESAPSPAVSGARAETEAGISALLSDLENLLRSVATLGELTPRSQDGIASFGERLSSLVVVAGFRARGLQAELVDSRRIIVTDSRFTGAAPDMSATESRARAVLAPLLEAGKIPVAQGFIGANSDGVTTTLGRGGSDYSGAILGAALGAEAIEIWTDVDGMMTADPGLIPEARRLRVISFAEASELSFFGARVLHPSTVLPAVERGIPVHIYNTRNPSCEGTRIVARPEPTSNPIKSVAYKRGVTIVNVTSTRMLQAYGFLNRIFEIFARHETPVDVVTTSEVSVSMTIDSPERLPAIEAELRQIGEVAVERGRAIVCVVGDNLKGSPGFVARIFQALGPTPIHMISQGASEINLTFVIEEQDVEPVVRKIHREFFATVDEAVFA